MQRFAELCEILESARSTRAKIAALISYFQDAPPEDAIWAMRLLRGWKPARVATPQELRAWARDLMDVPDWLFEASCDTVGNLIETLALIGPRPDHPADIPLHVWIQTHLLPLKDCAVQARQAAVLAAWQQMDAPQRYVWNTLLTASFRPHVAETTLIRALSVWRGLPATVLACRLQREWAPTAAAYRALFSHDVASLEGQQPYPFHPCQVFAPPSSAPLAAASQRQAGLGPLTAWQVHWHWKGMRVQLVKRANQAWLWSDEQALVNEIFPDICAALMACPDGSVLEGTIVAWNDDHPARTADLQRRIKKKRATPALIRQTPVRCWVDDLLEERGSDARPWPACQRFEATRAALAGQEADSPIHAALSVQPASWEEADRLRDQARQHGADGLLLKRRHSVYHSGLSDDHWLIWRAEPLTMLAVLLYVQFSHAITGGRRVEATFGVWNGEQLVPVAKTNAGFSEQDLADIEAFAKDHTRERFGPVRSLTPELVFRVAYDDVSPSTRHKSGLLLEHPHVVDRERNSRIHEADTLERLRAHLRA
jgi:DNA ligase 1